MGFTLCFYIYFLSLPLKRKLVMNYSEEQFILGINQKNREVFHELYRRFYRMLVHFAMKYLEDSALAEDVVQDTFVSLWERHECFLSYGRLRNFLYLSVRNTCLDMLKHRVVESKYSDYCQRMEEHAASATDEIIGAEVMQIGRAHV